MVGDLESFFEETFPDEFERLSYELWVQNFITPQDGRTDDRGRLVPRELDQSNSGVVHGRIRHPGMPIIRGSEAGETATYDAQVKIPKDIDYPIHASDNENVDHATEIVDPSDGKRYRVTDYYSEHNSLLALDVRELPGTQTAASSQ